MKRYSVSVFVNPHHRALTTLQMSMKKEQIPLNPIIKSVQTISSGRLHASLEHSASPAVG